MAAKGAGSIRKVQTMKTLAEFKSLNNVTEYLAFFEIACDERLVQSKRFHILRLFGEQIAKLEALDITDESRLLDIYRFALLSIVKRYEEGYNPSAAEIWGLMEKPGGCLACATSVGCNSNQSACSSTPTFNGETFS